MFAACALGPTASISTVSTTIPLRAIAAVKPPACTPSGGGAAALYIACGDDDVIAILDVATLKVAGKLKCEPSPEAFAIDETRRRIYVSQEEGSSLAIIDVDRE